LHYCTSIFHHFQNFKRSTPARGGCAGVMIFTRGSPIPPPSFYNLDGVCPNPSMSSQRGTGVAQTHLYLVHGGWGSPKPVEIGQRGMGNPHPPRGVLFATPVEHWYEPKSAGQRDIKIWFIRNRWTCVQQLRPVVRVPSNKFQRIIYRKNLLDARPTLLKTVNTVGRKLKNCNTQLSETVQLTTRASSEQVRKNSELATEDMITAITQRKSLHHYFYFILFYLFHCFSVFS
jgi:hypothetical protein